MTVHQVVTPTGVKRTVVTAKLPQYGLQCVCYKGMRRGEVIPSSYPYSMETRVGLSRYTCTCLSPLPGAELEPEQMSAIVADPTFQRHAADAIAAEISGRSSERMTFTSEAVEQRRMNYPVIGGAALILGAAIFYYLYKRSG